MPRHTIRDITLFVATYEERSFTGAAERENATQSGVSQHVRKLELQFGVSLFERTGGLVAPTPAGDAYYKYCAEILRASNAAEKALAQFSGGLDGKLSVGLMPTVTRSCLSGPLAEIKARNRNAQITIIEGYSGDLTAAVKSGALDFAIVPKCPSEAGLTSRRFVNTPEVLVGASGAKFGGSAPAPPQLLSNAKLILPTARNLRRRIIDDWLLENDVWPARILEMDSMMGTLDLIRESDWVSVLPALLVEREFCDPDQAKHYRIAHLDASFSDTPLVSIERSRSAMSGLGIAFLDLLRARCYDALSNIGLRRDA